ncbi:hypothetical protein ACFVQ4_05180 [Streptomyces laurentii]
MLLIARSEREFRQFNGHHSETDKPEEWVAERSDDAEGPADCRTA